MKKCTKCENDKDEKKFYKNKTKNDGLSQWCKSCTTRTTPERSKINNKKNTEIAQQVIDSFKEEKKCEKCGYNEYKCCLDFHHKDPKQKSFNISTGGRKSIKRLEEEIRKCVILCSNCHRTFHYLEKTKNITIEQFLN